MMLCRVPIAAQQYRRQTEGGDESDDQGTESHHEIANSGPVDGFQEISYAEQT